MYLQMNVLSERVAYEANLSFHHIVFYGNQILIMQEVKHFNFA